MSEILFADDDAPMRRMVADVLRSAGYHVRLAENGRRALEEIRSAPPDLALLDYRMGEPDGFQVCQAIKHDSRLAHLPVLILTAEGSMEDRIEGFGAGADDYLPKPFDPRELLARIRALLRLAREGRDRNPTTGLPGSEAFQREFDRRLRRADPFVLCYLDLDYFKPFNDRFGFAVADLVIRSAGDAVAAAAAERGAFVGHIGGDDFVAICDRGQGRSLVAAARFTFDAALPRYVEEKVIDAGSYVGSDREGRVRNIPLTRISAAVVLVDPAGTHSLADLSELLARTKLRAKHEADGIAMASYPIRPDAAR
jgi:PleD family two-component response regulator